MAPPTTFNVFGNRIAQIVFNCIFSIGIIAGNLILIGCITSNRGLRRKPKYILVLFLAVADLFLGVFAIPMWTHALVTQTLDFSCVTSLVLYGSSYIHIAISCLAVVSINLSYIFQQTMANYQGGVRTFMTVLLAAFFLIVPFAVLLPIFVFGASFATTCILVLKPAYSRAAIILSYWAPVLVIILTTLYVIVIYHKSRRRVVVHQQLPGTTPQPQQSAHGNNPSDLIFAAVLTVTLNLPSEIMILIGQRCALGDCYWYFIMVTVFGYISEAKSILLPFVWFSNKGFRNAMKGRSGTSPIPPPIVYYTQPPVVSSPGGQAYVYNEVQSPNDE